MKKNIQKTDYFRDVLQNRVLVFTALFVTILCYGFAVTHQSIGVDDVAQNFYLYSDGSWNMIRQGRLLHVLLNTVTCLYSVFHGVCGRLSLLSVRLAVLWTLPDGM